MRKDIKYCVTAFIDLLGFSSHLEIGKDLRTNIGQEAIKRLTILEDCLDKLLQEKKHYPKYYPTKLQIQRINDSLILAIDLPDFLLPSIGANVRDDLYTGEEFSERFSDKDLETEESFEAALKEKTEESITELTQFVGLVCRLHSAINRKENDNYFPGAKTIISTGFRKSFITRDKKEDYFSANFSFSNAYIAESQLKGSRLYIDNNIIHLLSKNKNIKNILIISTIFDLQKYDPLDDSKKQLYKIGEIFNVSLFRQNYSFRELKTHSAAYLQLFCELKMYIDGAKKIKSKKKHFTQIIDNFKIDKSSEEIIKNIETYRFFRFDIDDNIEVSKQLIVDGKSKILDKLHEIRMNSSDYMINNLYVDNNKKK